jgi:hypothetical protein
MTSETLIKWHEIGVTPEQSDRLGLIIFGIGIVTVVAGRLLAKAGRRADRSHTGGACALGRRLWAPVFASAASVSPC